MNNIEQIKDELKMMMNCKCYAMQSGSNSKCAQNCGCDGSCKLFKNLIHTIEDSLKQ